MRLNLLLILLIYPVSLIYGQDAANITRQLFATVKNVKTIKYNFESRERLMKGKEHIEKSTFKVNVSPLKVYIYQHYPKEGLQCLYVTGANNNKAKINPNSFPWVTVNLEPESAMMLQDRHHSIFDAGFAYTISVLEFLLNKYHPQHNDLVKLNGIKRINGEECYHLTFTNPNYNLMHYVVKENETPITIARKLHINFYAILENNPSLNATSPVKPGSKITVPNDYASKMELYIHKDKFYPVFLQVFDRKGLYEEFSFLQVVLNPPFKEIDFSEDNPAYKF